MYRYGMLFWLVLAATPFAQAPNVLSETEKAEGWRLMFNGTSLEGWHSFRKPGITENGWIIKDSSIYMRGPAAGGLLAPDSFVYKNFEITIDWKLPDSGNSGIFMRYLETEASENLRTGPETQICGKSHGDYRGGTTVTSPGACYAMYSPAEPWIRPAEAYNTLVVIMYEERVAHFGNGKRLLEYEIGDPDWSARYAVSKYQSFPLYGDIHAGKLFLQDHASHVWYRNIKIRPLTEDPWKTPGFVWPDQRVGINRQAGKGAPGMRILSASSGRIRLGFDRPAAWDLRLGDILGRGRATASGFGSEAAIDINPSSGAFWLIGTINKRPILPSTQSHGHP